MIEGAFLDDRGRTAPAGAAVFDGRYRVPLQRNLSTDE
jgi:hypothetical protein